MTKYSSPLQAPSFLLGNREDSISSDARANGSQVRRAAFDYLLAYRLILVALALTPIAVKGQQVYPTTNTALWVGAPPPINTRFNEGDANINGSLTVGGSTNLNGPLSIGGSLGVTGPTTTNGITNTGNVQTGTLQTDTLQTTGDSTVGGSLGVTGPTTTNGITNTGNVQTGTLQTTGDSTVGGSLGVTGPTTTNGITNTGNVQTGTLQTGTLQTTGDSTVGGSLGVTGATTTNGITNTGAISTASLVVGAPPALPPLPGQLWVNGQQISGNGIQMCSGAVPSSSICIGENATWSGQNATVMGTSAGAVAGGTAIGAQAVVSGERGTAIGFGAKAGNPGTAIGAFAEATGRHATAAGFQAKATWAESVAIGTGANAGFAGSVAIGPGATTTAPDQVVIGTSGSRLTIPGVAANGAFVGNANQSGSTRILTTDGNGNVGTSTIDPAQIESSIRSLGDAVTSAGAIASAFTAVPQVVGDPNEAMRCGAGLGGYGSSYAAALGCAVRVPNSSVHLNAALALTSSVDYGYDSTPSVAGRIGISVALGPRPKSQPLTHDQAAELNELRRQIQEIKSKLDTAVEPSASKENPRL